MEGEKGGGKEGWREGEGGEGEREGGGRGKGGREGGGLGLCDDSTMDVLSY